MTYRELLEIISEKIDEMEARQHENHDILKKLEHNSKLNSQLGFNSKDK